MQHLLDGVVGLTCVDPSMHSSISAAPLVVSTILQQCIYVCHAASSCQALLSDGNSSFWWIMRHVALARERYLKLNTPSYEQHIIPKKSEINNKHYGQNLSVSGVSVDASNVSNNVRLVPGSQPSSSYQQQKELLLSPLDFRVVVVGGGRVGRAIVGRLLQAPDLIHPSRITIITRQPETVAQFAGQGVQCKGRRGGRQALMECHVLIVACQQTQFYDFVGIYCPRSTRKTALLATSQGRNGHTEGGEVEEEKKPVSRRQKARRTLQEVVNKWRTIEDDDYEDFLRGVAPMTQLLKPGTFVFSCCAALETHKIAKELGHLDPLVVSADVDMNAVNSVALQFHNIKESLRSDFIERAAFEGNAFLRTLALLQQESYVGNDKSSFLNDPFCSGSLHSGPSSSETNSFRKASKRRKELQQVNMGAFSQAEGVGGTTTFLLRVWRALRCFVVSRVVLFKPEDHRLFMYLQRTGHLLGAIFVTLPQSARARVVRLLTEQLLSLGNSFDDDRSDGTSDHLLLVRVDHRHISAYDSEDDAEEFSEFSSDIRELARLVACFPALFKSVEEALQQLRNEFITVTRRWGEGRKITPPAAATAATATAALTAIKREKEENSRRKSQ